MHVVNRVMNDGWMDEWMYVHIDVLHVDDNNCGGFLSRYGRISSDLMAVCGPKPCRHAN